MKNLRKPLSVFLAVIMLFGIFAGALTTFAAGSVEENERVKLNAGDYSFSFTPTRSGLFIVALDVEEAEGDYYGAPYLSIWADYYDTYWDYDETVWDVYSVSNDKCTKQYKVFNLDQGIKYNFCVEEDYGEDFNATAKVIYLSAPELRTNNIYNIDGFAVYKFTPGNYDNYIFSTREKYYYEDWELSGCVAKTDIMVKDEDPEEGTSYYGFGPLTETSLDGEREFVGEYNFNQEKTRQTLAKQMSPNKTYYVFVLAGSTIDRTDFCVSGVNGEAINSVNIDSSAIPNGGYMSYGDPFPSADSLKVMSVNKDYNDYYYDDEQDQDAELPANSVKISNVKFVNYDKDVAEQNENYWVNAPATNDRFMKDAYLMCFDVDVNGNYFFFSPSMRFFYEAGNTEDYDYPWGTVEETGKVKVAFRIDASKFIKDGLYYELDSENHTATVSDYDDYKQTTYNIPEKITVASEQFTVTKIGSRALMYSGATSVTIPKTVTEICYKSLANIKAASLTIPESVKKISAAAFYGDQKLKKINVNASNANYSAANGILYNKDKTVLHTYPAGATAKSITIPSPVRTIGDSAFGGSKYVTSVSLNKVTALEPAAFNNSSIQNTTVPAAVKTISASSFENSKITNINILGATKIDTEAFYGTNSLKEIFIPKSVTEIGERAFHYSALKKIVFSRGSQLAKLGNFAFGYQENWDWDDVNDREIITTDPIKGFTACYFTSDAKVRTLLNSLQKNVNAKTAIKYIPISNNNIAKCTITLGRAATYSGKNITPGIVVKSGLYVLKKGVDYTVTYSRNKAVGRAVVTITGKGSFVGKVSKTFNILPRGTKLSSVKGGKKSLTVKWAKQATQTNGYQIQYSLKSNFAGAKTVKVGKNVTSKKLSRLIGGKRYYVRIRTYRTVGKLTFYSAWSGAKYATTKK